MSSSGPIEAFDQSTQNSNIERLNLPLFNEKGIEVYVKRDDKIHPFISGNKWRKLKYYVKFILENDVDEVITFGGAYSNHLLAVACAGALFGFKTRGVVRGEELNKTSNKVLQFCDQFGMSLEFVERSAYSEMKVKAGYEGGEYFIPEGGAGALGRKGCADMLFELDQTYDRIILDVGTGTTYAGILEGVHGKQLDTKVEGIVVLKNGEYLQQEIADQLPNLQEHIHLHLDYHFGGFGKWDNEQEAFNKEFSSQTGIFVDPVYTGKLFRAIIDLTKKDHFPVGSKVLVIHTGGLMGALS